MLVSHEVIQEDNILKCNQCRGSKGEKEEEEKTINSKCSNSPLIRKIVSQKIQVMVPTCALHCGEVTGSVSEERPCVRNPHW